MTKTEIYNGLFKRALSPKDKAVAAIEYIAATVKALKRTKGGAGSFAFPAFVDLLQEDGSGVGALVTCYANGLQYNLVIAFSSGPERRRFSVRQAALDECVRLIEDTFILLRLTEESRKKAADLDKLIHEQTVADFGVYALPEHWSVHAHYDGNQGTAKQAYSVAVTVAGQRVFLPGLIGNSARAIKRLLTEVNKASDSKPKADEVATKLVGQKSDEIGQKASQ